MRLGLILVGATCLLAGLGNPIFAEEPSRQAGVILAQTRQALGETGRFDRLERLVVGGDARFADGTRVERRVSISFPAAFEEEEIIHFGGNDLTVSKIAELTPGGASLRPGTVGVPLLVELDQKQREELAVDLRERLLLTSLMFVCGAPPALHLEATYAGRAEARDGVADVLEFRVDGRAVGQLFLDAASHRPLMLRYEGQPKRATERPTGGGPKDPTVRPKEPKLETVDVRLADFKRIDGILLPHHLTTSVGQEVIEEWDIGNATATVR